MIMTVMVILMRSFTMTPACQTAAESVREYPYAVKAGNGIVTTRARMDIPAEMWRGPVMRLKCAPGKVRSVLPTHSCPRGRKPAALHVKNATVTALLVKIFPMVTKMKKEKIYAMQHASTVKMEIA